MAIFLHSKRMKHEGTVREDFHQVVTVHRWRPLDLQQQQQHNHKLDSIFNSPFLGSDIWQNYSISRILAISNRLENCFFFLQEWKCLTLNNGPFFLAVAS